MCAQQIIMSYTVPPSFDDLSVMTREILDSLPEELIEYCEDLEVVIEDVPDEAIMQEFELEDPFELLVLFRKGNEIVPGVESKSTDGEDRFVLYRRSILDLWCEEGEDLTILIRQLVIEELGRMFDFSDEDVEEMVARHHQGML
ncbi:metallopeptidase family protein [Alphaproteobacteria bacterium]|nr:metallopeptidase family protein [Alphaproteobacteria bacterium]